MVLLSISVNNSMEYKPSLPEHNDNVSHDQPVREFIVLFSGITVFLLLVFWATGLLVDYAVDYISPEMEITIFSSFSGSEDGLVGVEDTQQAELQSIVDQLGECIHLAYPLTVHLVDNEKANAMASPGGRIIVFKGLLDKVKSKNGLSFVLAHELAHFIHRDHLRGMGRGIVITTIVALVTGAGSDLTQLFTPAVNFNMAQYSQTRESLADQKALEILACYYGHVGGASEFFEAMTPDDSEKENLFGHYFDSHPEALERIRDLHRRTKEMNFEVRPVTSLPDVLRN